MDTETARTIGNILGFLLIAWLVWRAHQETKGTSRSDTEQEED